MIPKKYLYGENDFEINDLIRDAHPFGGTEVVSTESGEGFVEDIIEAQMKTLEMVFKQPTLKILADLGNQLDSEGLFALASEVDTILNKFAEDNLKDIRLEFFELVYPLKDMINGLEPSALNVLLPTQLNEYIEYMDELLAELNKSAPDFDLILEYAQLIARDDVLYGATWEVGELNLQSEFGDDPKGRVAFKKYVKMAKTLQQLSGNYAKTYGDGFVAEEESPAKAKEREDAAGAGASGKGKPSNHNETMELIQRGINKILGKKVVPENGNVGDKKTWSVVKNHFGFTAPEDFKNYHELLSLIQAAGGRVPAKSDGKGQPSKSKWEEEVQITHVDFEYPAGNQIKNFPLSRAIKEVNVKDSRQMRDAANMYVAWLRAYGLLQNRDISAIINEMPQIGNALLSAKVPGTDQTINSMLPRIKNYLSAIHDYFIKLKLMREQAAEAKKNQKQVNIFDFLDGEYPKPAHPYFLIGNHPGAKSGLLSYLVNHGYADKSGNMIVGAPQVRGGLPMIAERVKELVRGYGLGKHVGPGIV